MTEARNERYWQDLDDRAAELPDWKLRRRQRMAVELYGGVTASAAAGSDTPESLPSLATCEQLSRTDAVPGFSEGGLSRGIPEESRHALQVAFRLGVEDVDRAARLVTSSPTAPEVLHRLLDEPDQERIEKGLALLDENPAAARRFAACGQQSVQLQCPDDFGAGGCGHRHNYVPITCDHRMCEDCMKRRIGKLVEQYVPRVREWDSPAFHTYTIENVESAESGVERVREAFGRFRQRTIPTAGQTNRDGAVKRWDWTDSGQPAELWKARLLENGRHDLVRRLQRKYVDQGRNIPVDEVIHGGFYGIDVKQVGPDEYNVHIHALVDSAYIPQSALSAVWEDVSGAPVVDVRRVYDRGGESVESVVAETVAYACKPPEFDDPEQEAAFSEAISGSRLVQPFGRLHGNTPDLGGSLLCSNCEAQPAWWDYLGVVDEHRDNMGSVHDGQSSGNDPPESEE